MGPNGNADMVIDSSVHMTITVLIANVATIAVSHVRKHSHNDADAIAVV